MLQRISVLTNEGEERLSSTRSIYQDVEMINKVREDEEKEEASKVE